ncbi:HAD-IIIA family hydrolase [Marivirga sp. S37H4]|uniref:D,D-heptose 1,7-bisphosphate phosphatase n=1 Tax=Marivirga aurantiaca TaxID=2802615 RepID=A0A935C6C8_9BACT|nr:HAD-IIIA family hydrolase [Marivirga aurantiaca]MBK6263667.1 HAD-IIIA family hydrolase [Marivirga aurantiaca]
MKLKPCIFLDRDGVINEERGEYTYRLEDFRILPKVKEAFELLKDAGYLLVVITNQAGIAKGVYGANDVIQCHQYLQERTGHLIDGLYYAPQHPTVTESLLRKPDSLMLEKAIVKFGIDPSQSWMVGDSERDLIAAGKVGVKGILITDQLGQRSDFEAENLYEAVIKFIL